MFDLKLFTKQDSVVGSLQPVAQLDIFNRRIAIRFIETVEREENIAADRAAAGPKRKSFLASRLMHVVVQQIRVLGEKIGRAGRVIVRAENGRKVEIPSKDRRYLKIAATLPITPGETTTSLSTNNRIVPLAARAP